MKTSLSKRLVGLLGVVALSLVCLLGSAALAPAQERQAAQKRIYETDELAERLRLAHPAQREAFPRLGNEFKVLAPRTRTYNCIAWTTGNTSEWVWPGNHLADFDRLYAKQGYVRQEGLNLAVESGKQKIAVYAVLNRDGTIDAVTHGAVQQPDGTWTSKLGGLVLIRHPTLESLRGPTYGTPVAVYVRTAG